MGVAWDNILSIYKAEVVCARVCVFVCLRVRPKIGDCEENHFWRTDLAWDGCGMGQHSQNTYKVTQAPPTMGGAPGEVNGAMDKNF